MLDVPRDWTRRETVFRFDGFIKNGYRVAVQGADFQIRRLRVFIWKPLLGVHSVGSDEVIEDIKGVSTIEGSLWIDGELPEEYMPGDRNQPPFDIEVVAYNFQEGRDYSFKLMGVYVVDMKECRFIAAAFMNWLPRGEEKVPYELEKQL